MILGFLIPGIVASLAGAIEEAKAEQAFINALPDNLREAAIIKRQQRWDENKAHRKALEIAKAGRTKNFWGN